MPPAAAIGAKVALGALIAKKKSGGGGGAPAVPAAVPMTQEGIAGQIFSETTPLRQGLIQRSADYLGGGIDSSPQFSAFKSAAEPQFAAARQQIISDTPAGGALTSALTDLESNRARALTEGRGAIDEQELARAFSLATGSDASVMGAFGQSAAIRAQQEQAKAAEKNSIYQLIGSGAGAYLGSKKD